MLVEFINFADEQNYHKRFIIYNLALKYHNFSKIFKFRKVFIINIIIKKFKLDIPFYLSQEIVELEYNNFLHYYKSQQNIEDYHLYLKLIMDTINNIELYENYIM